MVSFVTWSTLVGVKIGTCKDVSWALAGVELQFCWFPGRPGDPAAPSIRPPTNKVLGSVEFTVLFYPPPLRLPLLSKFLTEPKKLC